METFNYSSCSEGEILCLTNEDGHKIFGRIVSYSDYLMAIIDQNGYRHAFLNKWFDKTSDVFYGVPTFECPNGVNVKFHKATTKDLPFMLKLKAYFGKF